MSPVGLIILLACFGLLVWVVKIRRERRLKLPPPITNQLEQSIRDAADAPSGERLLNDLRDARFLVPMSNDGTPMMFSGRIPNPSGNGEVVELGPHIYAFTSPASIHYASNHPELGSIIRTLLTKTGCSKPVDTPSKELFQAALAKQCPVWVNPFVGLSKALSLEELRQLITP